MQRVPIEDVCRDYFSHLNPTKLVQKISAGEIAIPLVRMEASQKCAKGIHLVDLAKYLDARVEAARKEMMALTTPEEGTAQLSSTVSRSAVGTP